MSAIARNFKNRNQNESGSIAMYETGRRQPPLTKARAIARFFGVSTDDIEYGNSSQGEHLYGEL